MTPTNTPDFNGVVVTFGLPLRKAGKIRMVGAVRFELTTF